MKQSEKRIRQIITMIRIEAGIREPIDDHIIQYCKNAGMIRKGFYEWYYDTRDNFNLRRHKLSK
ncbi:MAG: hypothetical protein GY853_06570 [PVC group bacterium]|nr:hypothetical protein [PVC group bacterium]